MVGHRTKRQATAVSAIDINDNITVPIGLVSLVRAVFRELELDSMLGSLKRNQGISVTDITVAPVTHAMQMEDILDDPHRREIYGLDDGTDKNDLYRGGKRLGQNIDAVVAHIDSILGSKFGISFEKVFLDWSASYLDGKQTEFIRFGHTKDHRPDRPVSIGMTMEAVHGLLCGPPPPFRGTPTMRSISERHSRR
ncbi:MAG: hypothetical protein AB7V07_03410 [Candidatus Delongbacteria bacterium]